MINIFAPKKLLFSLCFLLLLPLTACKEDNFENAPVAKAPPASSSPATQSEPESNGLGPVSGTSLPANHPPIGNVDGNNTAPPAMAQQQQKLVDPSKFGSQGPLMWTAPENWKGVLPSNSMRLAEYRVPGPENVEPGELTVFHFGATGGGGVDANLDRWASQFRGGEPATKTTQTVDGMTVYRVDASGSYDPGMAGGGGPAKENQRLLGAIVETPVGLFFFKLVGPVETLEMHEDHFEGFVQSFRLAGA